MRLAEAFAAGLPAEKGKKLGRSASEVERLFAAASADAAFARAVGERLANESDPVEALRGLILEDLLLAHRAASGELAAVAELDARIVMEARSVARPNSALSADELAQGLRQRVLVAEAGGKPRLLDYGGRGPLKKWLKVAAVRVLQNASEAKRPEPAADEVLRGARDSRPDPELEYLKTRYGSEFKAALDAAFAELTARERNLLRLHVVEQLGLDRIAVMHQVHRATAARWLQAARERVMESTRQKLEAKLALREGEFKSLLALVRSQLDVSIRRHLGEGEPAPPSPGGRGD